MSVISTFEAFNFFATIDKIPLPQPKSRTLSPSLTYSTSCLIQSCVVSCLPVPKAVPGSISIIFIPLCSSSTSSQVGLIKNSPTIKDLKYFFQLLTQSTSSVVLFSILPSPTLIKLLASFNFSLN